MHALAWNVGGLTPETALQLLGDLRKERIWPFENAFAVCLQEIIIEEGKHEFEKGDLHMFAGKVQDEWRGTAIVHTNSFQHGRTKLLKAGTCCTLTAGSFSFRVLSGHLPHHATLLETEEILATWQNQLQGDHRCFVGLDANETFKPGRGLAILSDSARGEMLLGHLNSWGIKLPPQDLGAPSYFPYNTQMRPRRLDYVFTRHLLAEVGKVLACRDLARSDHEPILLELVSPEVRPPPPEVSKTWGVRKLRPHKTIEKLLADHVPTSRDPVAAIADIAQQVTKAGTQIERYRESQHLRSLRRDLLRASPGPERKQMWKDFAKQRRTEHRAWCQAKLDAAGQGFWQSKKAVDQDKHDNAWELRLRGQERWRETLIEHFGGIFHKLDTNVVATRMRGIMDRMGTLCKSKPWRPFSEEEIKAVRKRWKNNKSCGPDGVSHEALKVLENSDYWRHQLLRLFDDMLYTAKIPANIERGITVLLAKSTQPGDWSDTRPITLSSALLKTFSQLLIGRVSPLVQGDSRLQWARRSRQGVELILSLRRLCRVSHDWGLTMYVAKLDIRKAFDSIYQEALAEQIEQDVCIKGDKPWEGRAWTALIHAQNLEIFFRGETFKLQQSNGVRQGSPDSPIAFGRIVAKDLEQSIAEASPHKPTTGEPPPENGGCFMDDSYLWSTSATHMQAMLTRIDSNFPKRGLDIHPVKTDIIDNQGGGTPFQVSGRRVLSKGPDHIIRVLGSPLSFHGQPAMLVAEMQSRGRRAFEKHRGTLMSAAPLKGRIQLHTILVRQSALWACETWPSCDFLLRSANSMQTAQVRSIMKLSKHPGETWYEWNVRSLRRARLAIHQSKVQRWSSFILQQIWGIHGHVARGDPITAAMLRWRNLEWWAIEQTIPVSWGGHRHARRFNPHLDVDRQISAVAGNNWQLLAQDRQAWGNLEDVFIDRHDVPWASGGQGQLENLMPNKASSKKKPRSRARNKAIRYS